MPNETIGVDVSQFFKSPAASGIQRVLSGLAASWPSDSATGLFVYEDGDGFRVMTPAQFTKVIGLVFAQNSDPAAWPELVKEAGRKASREVGDIRKLSSLVDRWLLGDLTFDEGILKRFDYFSQRVPTGLIFYDAIPETSPESFDTTGGFSTISRYYRRAALAPTTVSISESSDRVLTQRLRRPGNLRSVVASPGADDTAAATVQGVPATATFTMVGTLEPRKRHELMLDAVELLRPQWGRFKVNFAGRPHPAAVDLNRRIDALRAAGAPIYVVSAAKDSDLHELYRNSTAVFSLGEEGYGLPVLEAIRNGCPVVFTGEQPAAELCLGTGTIRLEDDSAECLAETLTRLLDQQEAATLRSQVDPESVPTWDAYARDVVLGILEADRPAANVS